jgi:hypothetical protein
MKGLKNREKGGNLHVEWYFGMPNPIDRVPLQNTIYGIKRILGC